MSKGSRNYGVGAATGELTACELGDRLGLEAGEVAAVWTSESFNAFKSGLLIKNVPSRWSRRANHIPSGVPPPLHDLIGVAAAPASARERNGKTSWAQ